MASASELVSKANELFVEEDYSGALDLYSKAIALEPQARAQGEQGPLSAAGRAGGALFEPSAPAGALKDTAGSTLPLQDFSRALDDASAAAELEPRNPKALLRKGAAAFHLDRFGVAREAFEAALALEPGSAALEQWLRKCDAELAEGQGGIPISATAPRTPAAPDASAPAASTSAAAPQPTPPQQYRHQWFQSATHVTVEVLAKGVPPDCLDVKVEEAALRVAIAQPGGAAPYALDVELFGAVDPAAAAFAALPTKVEVKLRKRQPLQWADLRRPAGGVVVPPPPPMMVMAQPPAAQPAAAASSATVVVAPAAVVPLPKPPMHARKDWDAIEKELEKEEKEEKLEGDAALNKLFRDIYARADDDTRRAMNKSFQESNGTVLSTNWREVGAKETEFQPPEGMVARKFEI